MTLNKLLRAHWGKKGSDLKNWKEWVLSVAGKGPWWCSDWKEREAMKVAVPAQALFRITVYRKRLQDRDNAVGSVKPLVDALVWKGWAADDSVQWLKLEVEERVDRKEPRTEVYWEPIASRGNREKLKEEG